MRKYTPKILFEEQKTRLEKRLNKYTAKLENIDIEVKEYRQQLYQSYSAEISNVRDELDKLGKFNGTCQHGKTHLCYRPNSDWYDGTEEFKRCVGCGIEMKREQN